MNYEQYNISVENWGRQANAGIKNTGRGYGIRHRSNSPSSSDSLAAMKDKYRQKNGAVNVISFTFNRPLIYTMTGAGRGQGGLKVAGGLMQKELPNAPMQPALTKPIPVTEKQNHLLKHTWIVQTVLNCWAILLPAKQAMQL